MFLQCHDAAMHCVLPAGHKHEANIISLRTGADQSFNLILIQSSGRYDQLCVRLDQFAIQQCSQHPTHVLHVGTEVRIFVQNDGLVPPNGSNREAAFGFDPFALAGGRMVMERHNEVHQHGRVHHPLTIVRECRRS